MDSPQHQRSQDVLLSRGKRVADRADGEGDRASGLSAVDGEARAGVGLTARCSEELGVRGSGLRYDLLVTK